MEDEKAGPISSLSEEVSQLVDVQRQAEPFALSHALADIWFEFKTTTTNLAHAVALHVPEDVAELLQSWALPVFVALLVIAVFTFSCLLCRVVRPKRLPTILLYGPSGAGKTDMFYALQGIQLPHGCVTSIEKNVSSVATKGRFVHLVDIPGHPRMAQMFEDAVSTADGVIFVIDATDFVQRKSEIARQLLGALSSTSRSSRTGRVLLACNKTDQGAKAFSQPFILKQLEKEISVLRGARQAQLGRDKASKGDGLGKADAPFSFERVGPRFQACSVSALKMELEPVLTFMAQFP